MNAAPCPDFSKMHSAESFYLLSYLLDNLEVNSLRQTIDLLYPKHRSFRIVICQWLNSGHFSSTYYIETTQLLWSGIGEPDYDAELVYVDDVCSGGVEETKSTKRKREELSTT